MIYEFWLWDSSLRQNDKIVAIGLWEILNGEFWILNGKVDGVRPLQGDKLCGIGTQIERIKRILTT